MTLWHDGTHSHVPLCPNRIPERPTRVYTGVETCSSAIGGSFVQPFL